MQKRMEDFIEDAPNPQREDDGHIDKPRVKEEKRPSFWVRLWNWLKRIFG